MSWGARSGQVSSGVNESCGQRCSWSRLPLDVWQLGPVPGCNDSRSACQQRRADRRRQARRALAEAADERRSGDHRRWRARPQRRTRPVAEARRSALLLVQSGKGSGDNPIPEGAEALGRIGGRVLTVAIAESGGLLMSAELSVVCRRSTCPGRLVDDRSLALPRCAKHASDGFGAIRRACLGQDLLDVPLDGCLTHEEPS
jgi:hypothetical protein